MFNYRGTGLIITAVLFISYTHTAFATQKKAPSDTEAQSKAIQINENHSFELTRQFTLNSDTDLIRFLFRHLHVTGSMLSVWNLGDFSVTKKSPRYFIATKDDDLDGDCYRIKFTNRIVKYVGDGIYRPNEAPITIPGQALVKIKWKAKGSDQLRVKATLILQPSNWLMRWVGSFLHPIIKPELQRAFEQLIDRGKQITDRINKKPNETYKRLLRVDSTRAKLWKSFTAKRTSARD